jgi:hypothetical protein
MSVGQWFTQPGRPNFYQDPYIDRQVTIDGRDGVIVCCENSHKRVYYFYCDGCDDPVPVPPEWFLANPVTKKSRGAGGEA